LEEKCKLAVFISSLLLSSTSLARKDFVLAEDGPTVRLNTVAGREDFDRLTQTSLDIPSLQPPLRTAFKYEENATVQSTWLERHVHPFSGEGLALICQFCSGTAVRRMEMMDGD
jgi:hypothetical protein